MFSSVGKKLPLNSFEHSKNHRELFARKNDLAKDDSSLSISSAQQDIVDRSQ